MKKLIILVTIVVIIFSCKKVKEVFDITLPFSLNNEFTLPKLSDQLRPVPDSVVTIKSPDIVNTLPEEFKKNNANIDKIKSVTLDSITLTIKSPVGQNFSFLKTLKLYIGAQGKGDKLIASKDNIQSIAPAPTVLYLNVANSDIAEYIKGSTYYIKTELSLATTYTNDILIGSAIKGKAVANPL